MSEIDDVRAVLDAATPGPWRVTPNDLGVESESNSPGMLAELYGDTTEAMGIDARAIALLGSTWREALDVIEIAASPRQAGLRQAVDAWRAAVREHEGSEE